MPEGAPATAGGSRAQSTETVQSTSFSAGRTPEAEPRVAETARKENVSPMPKLSPALHALCNSRLLD